MILEELAAAAKRRVEEEKKKIAPERMEQLAMEKAKKENASDGIAPLPFARALAAPGMSFICEVKKASPSKGLIASEFPYLDIAREYEAAGASAISVLTEPTRFLGSNRYLEVIARTVNIPVLRKDFTVDAYQICQAKVLGAGAVLLIASLLDTRTIRDYLSLCRQLNLAALVEAHDEREIASALEAGAAIIGVNNRNLKDFSVDLNNSLRLRELVTGECLFVAESGIRTPEDIRRLREGNVDAVLIGETLMRSGEKRRMLDTLRGEDV